MFANYSQRLSCACGQAIYHAVHGILFKDTGSAAVNHHFLTLRACETFLSRCFRWCSNSQWVPRGRSTEGKIGTQAFYSRSFRKEDAPSGLGDFPCNWGDAFSKVNGRFFSRELLESSQPSPQVDNDITFYLKPPLADDSQGTWPEIKTEKL